MQDQQRNTQNIWNTGETTMRRYFTPTVLAAVMVIGLAAIVGAQFPGGGRGMQGQGMGQGLSLIHI